MYLKIDFRGSSRKKKSLGPTAIKKKSFHHKAREASQKSIQTTNCNFALKSSAFSLPPVLWHVSSRKFILMKKEVTSETM